MRSWANLFFAVTSMAVSGAATSADLKFDVHINIADQQALHREVTLEDGGVQRLQVDGSRILELKPWPGFGGDPWFEAVVIPLTTGDDAWQSVMQRPASVGPGALAVAFSFCGTRIIAVGQILPGRCADLPRPRCIPLRSQKRPSRSPRRSRSRDRPRLPARWMSV